MNLEQLRIFISVADHRSFTKAAEIMYISHSTTSRNVASLEENLGVKLLTRDNRSVELTPAGELLYREGAELLRRIGDIKSAVREAGQSLAGRLSIASANLYLGALHLSCRDFRCRHPDVTLGLRHHDMGDVWEEVLSGAADIGLTLSFALPREHALCNAEPLASERFCVVVPAGHPLAPRRTVGLGEIKNRVRLLSFPADAPAKPEGRRPHRPGNGDGAASVLEALFAQIRSGNGVSVVPYPVACEYGSGCAILDIEELPAPADVVLLWRKDNGNPALPLFLEVMAGRASR